MAALRVRPLQVSDALCRSVTGFGNGKAMKQLLLQFVMWIAQSGRDRPTTRASRCVRLGAHRLIEAFENERRSIGRASCRPLDAVVD